MEMRTLYEHPSSYDEAAKEIIGGRPVCEVAEERSIDVEELTAYAMAYGRAVKKGLVPEEMETFASLAFSSAVKINEKYIGKIEMDVCCLYALALDDHDLEEIYNYMASYHWDNPPRAWWILDLSGYFDPQPRIWRKMPHEDMMQALAEYIVKSNGKLTIDDVRYWVWLSDAEMDELRAILEGGV